MQRISSPCLKQYPTLTFVHVAAQGSFGRELMLGMKHEKFQCFGKYHAAIFCHAEAWHD